MSATRVTRVALAGAADSNRLRAPVRVLHGSIRPDRPKSGATAGTRVDRERRATVVASHSRALRARGPSDRGGAASDLPRPRTADPHARKGRGIRSLLDRGQARDPEPAGV